MLLIEGKPLEEKVFDVGGRYVVKESRCALGYVTEEELNDC